MVCSQCHKGIPANQGYRLHTWAGRLIVTCYGCKSAPAVSACGVKDAWYVACTAPYGHSGDHQR